MIIRNGNAEYLVLIRDKHGNYLEPFIKRRIFDEDANLIIMVSGRPREGKSNDCMLLAQRLRKYYGFHFPEDTSYIAMGTLEFMKILQTNPPPGSVLIYEEAPVGHNSRDWHTKEAAMLNNVLNTFGYKNHVWILNGVNWSDLDSQARKLVNLKIKVTHKSKHAGISYGEPKWYVYNDEKNDYIKTIPRGEKGEKLRRFKFGKSNKDEWKIYNKRKKEWNEERLAAMVKQSDELLKSEKLKNNVYAYEHILSAVLKRPDKFISPKKGTIMKGRLAAAYDLTPTMAAKYAEKINIEDMDLKEILRDHMSKKNKRIIAMPNSSFGSTPMSLNKNRPTKKDKIIPDSQNSDSVNNRLEDKVWRPGDD